MTFEVVPHQGIGPIRFGMTRDQVADAMRNLGSGAPVCRNSSTDMYLGNAFQVSFGPSGRSEFVEVASGIDASVMFAGLDVFRTCADDLFAAIQRLDSPDEQLSQPPVSFIFAALILSLWNPDSECDPDGGGRRVFCSVGLGDESYLASIRRIAVSGHA